MLLIFVIARCSCRYPFASVIYEQILTRSPQAAIQIQLKWSQYLVIAFDRFRWLYITRCMKNLSVFVFRAPSVTGRLTHPIRLETTSPAIQRLRLQHPTLPLSQRSAISSYHQSRPRHGIKH